MERSTISKSPELSGPDMSEFFDLASRSFTYPKIPKKLEIPIEHGEKFKELCHQITKRVEYLGISNPRTPDSLVVLTLEANEGMIRTGFLGQQRQPFLARLEALFGEKSWSFQHLIQGRLLDQQFAFRLYEEAYDAYFNAHPEVVSWLIKNFSDVYDNSPSNVNSGIDYSIQEVPDRGNHLHDIAIRAALKGRGYEFQGEELLQVRGKYGKDGVKPGFFLSPGEVEFNRPEIIPKDPFHARAWWKPGTVEDFYQRTRFLVVEEFRDDTFTPSNPQLAQQRESYYQRVAARCLLRTLPTLIGDEVTLSDIGSLPWMIDHNSFPLGPNGLPRAFSELEVHKILSAANQQLEGLFAKSGRDENLLGNEVWVGFNRSKEFLDILQQIYEKGHESLTEEQKKHFPEVTMMDSWKVVLPEFWNYIQERGSRPLFLARDGLAIMEYMSYRQDLLGINRFDPETSLRHSIYLPGSSSEHTSKNQRASVPLLERTIQNLFGITSDAYDALGFTTVPETPEARKQLQDEIANRIKQQFRDWREGAKEEDSLSGNSYEWWFNIYSDIKSQFNDSLDNLIVVDSDGTGKSVFFVKTMLEYFSEQNGESVSIDTLVGGLQKKHLGLPNLAELHGFNNDAQTNTVLPDIRWPFRFGKFDGEPTFNVRHSPTLILSLLYRSLQYYNFAVEDSRQG